MFLESVLQFAVSHRVSVGLALKLSCTAEHLVAKCEGGTDDASNIAAACYFCNTKRHARQVPLRVNEHRHLVRNRLNEGRWHAREVLAVAELVKLSARKQYR
ncbi:HNH endonuclease [Pseudoxanthomonas gei]